MNIIESLKSSDIENVLHRTLQKIHQYGPNEGEDLEVLSYVKEFFPQLFKRVEQRVLVSLGLFFKVGEPKNVYTSILLGFEELYHEEFGVSLTPVQANIQEALNEKKYISISAPTSAGKSYSIREYIYKEPGDVVVVVPSRALIAEYINSLRRKFQNDKNVMISSFVDMVYLDRSPRRVFVLTPERSRDIFSGAFSLNISLFFLDEAQISDERGRGVNFDVLVRRIREKFSESKVIFAHPFVRNPEAQLLKHGVPQNDSFCRSYEFGAIGRICVFQHRNGNYYYFSPYSENGHRIDNAIRCNFNFERFAFSGSRSVLVYVSKASIYDGRFIKGLEEYVYGRPELQEEEAVQIINLVSHFIGADHSDHRSDLVRLMSHGVVVHHGSVPLDVRFLIEDFIRKGFARICFATSTLAQGINMPFDVVWLNSMRFFGSDNESRSLAFKNLVGRAGRLSDRESFDYGYVFTRNPKVFSERVNDTFALDDESVIDKPLEEEDEDYSELIQSIKDDTFDDEKQLAGSKVARLSDDAVISRMLGILDLLFGEPTAEEVSEYGLDNIAVEDKSDLVVRFREIYEIGLNRSLLPGESAVFSQAIYILFFLMEGRSFREVVGLRFSYISRRDYGNRGFAEFVQQAASLPDKKLKRPFPLFEQGTEARNVSYDTVVYDTYDYVDQVISFSLSEVFIGAFKICADKTGDLRCEALNNFLTYRTNNPDYIMLIRYGFPPENVPEVSPYVDEVNENRIVFKESVEGAEPHVRTLVEWYLP